MSGVAVTGIGVVAPNGLGASAFWSATLAGQSAIGPISRFDASDYPVRLAAEVRDFVAGEHVPSRLIPQTDHWTHMGLTAAAMALDDGGVSPAELPEYEMAVVTASSSGGTEFGQREIERLWSKGPGWVGAYQSIAWFYAATTGQISIRHGMRGPCGVIAAEQAGSLDALAQARRLVERGSRIVVSGGADASLCPYGLTAQLSTDRLSRVTEPSRAYLPFDAAAAGYVPGEGGAMFVVEDDAAARARGVHRYGVLAGHAATFDPAPERGRPPTLARAIRRAVAEAGLTPGQVDAVFADAAGVPDLDAAEAAALVEVFGPHGVPVTAPKTMTGRAYAGAAIDVAAALFALRDQVLPPTVGVRDVAYQLDLVTGAARPLPLRAVLVLARGYGGFNSALVLTAPDFLEEA
ncbi:ketosynthase chain-length factor [Asanoa sp. WMMD1127]|uniref:ketosynthase chain-length factor n=1 Tax=Asanoa sp. WMMD1127 TaxID=3016107 RepID=UPI002415FBDA|nr:ketosynthase chain-length factor [Asanoa sp. WMMD1127]MDG4820741.1 ketosynthase chain-length factor [Asanoa sp. WMMD1127]